MSQDIIPEVEHTEYTGGVRKIDHTKARNTVFQSVIGSLGHL